MVNAFTHIKSNEYDVDSHLEREEHGEDHETDNDDDDEDDDLDTDEDDYEDDDEEDDDDNDDEEEESDEDEYEDDSDDNGEHGEDEDEGTDKDDEDDDQGVGDYEKDMHGLGKESDDDDDDDDDDYHNDDHNDHDDDHDDDDDDDNDDDDNDDDDDGEEEKHEDEDISSTGYEEEESKENLFAHDGRGEGETNKWEETDQGNLQQNEKGIFSDKPSDEGESDEDNNEGDKFRDKEENQEDMFANKQWEGETSEREEESDKDGEEANENEEDQFDDEPGGARDPFLSGSNTAPEEIYDDVPRDEPEEDEELKNSEERDRRQRLYMMICIILCCIVVIVAIVLGVLLSGKKKNGDDTIPKASSAAPTSAAKPATLAPTTLNPTKSPSPTTSPTKGLSISPGIADTYIRSGIFSTESFGTEDELLVQNGAGADDKAFALIQFILADLPPVENIFGVQEKFVLELYHVPSVGGNTSEIQIIGLPYDPNVDIESLTFHDFSFRPGEFGPTFLVEPDSEKVEVDVTSLIRSSSSLRGRRRLASEAVLLQLQSVEDSNDLGVIFRSLEYDDGSQRPNIVIQNTPLSPAAPPSPYSPSAPTALQPPVSTPLVPPTTFPNSTLSPKPSGSVSSPSTPTAIQPPSSIPLVPPTILPNATLSPKPSGTFQPTILSNATLSPKPSGSFQSTGGPSASDLNTGPTLSPRPSSSNLSSNTSTANPSLNPPATPPMLPTTTMPTATMPTRSPGSTGIPTVSPQPSISPQPTTCLEQIVPPVFDARGGGGNPLPEGAVTYVSQLGSSVTIRIHQLWSKVPIVWIAPYYYIAATKTYVCDKTKNLDFNSSIDITLPCYQNKVTFALIVNDNSIAQGDDLLLPNGCSNDPEDIPRQKVLYAFEGKCTPPPPACLSSIQGRR